MALLDPVERERVGKTTHHFCSQFRVMQVRRAPDTDATALRRPKPGSLPTSILAFQWGVQQNLMSCDLPHERSNELSDFTLGPENAEMTFQKQICVQGCKFFQGALVLMLV
jgi:hypothetical protein